MKSAFVVSYSSMLDQLFVYSIKLYRKHFSSRFSQKTYELQRVYQMRFGPRLSQKIFEKRAVYQRRLGSRSFESRTVYYFKKAFLSSFQSENIRKYKIVSNAF